MHDDPFPAAEKILTDIENVFKRDKALKDFEILPVTVGENKSPVLHAEHTLGLQEWCVRHLYAHVYHKVMALKKQQRLRREDPNILSRLLLGGILLNPDCTLMWNIRREFVVMGRFDPLTELHFNAVTLSRRPKTAEAFVYRRWVLNRIKANTMDAAASSRLLEEELRVALMAADRYANNYHAWNHRMWVMSHLPLANDALCEEWVSSEKWVSRHVSEHSGLQYRQYLLKQMVPNLGHSEYCSSLHQTLIKFFTPLKHSPLCSLPFKETTPSKCLYSLLTDGLEKKNPCAMCPVNCEQSPFILQIGLLAYELLLVTELIRLYPGHEALWCHRRFVLFSFDSLAEKIYSDFTAKLDVTDGIPLRKSQKLSVLEINFRDDFLWKVLLCHEDILISESTCKPQEECYQSKLAHKHKNWMEKILRSNFENPSLV